jgi:regulator of protease activity HflC (stomatin/prohibitin superfamily)
MLLGVLVAFAIIVLSMVVKVVPEYRRLVVFRLGRSIGQKGPGLVLIVPIVDRFVTVDLREIFFEIPQQTCITKDNAPINIDFLIYFKVLNPTASVVQVEDFSGAARGIAMTTLRAVVGDLPLDEILAKREQINTVLRAKLDEATERWGVKVTTVEIREIQPPSDVQQAMTRQMSAERSRRAVVTEADGTKQAAITVAEGEKQSAILKAEGDRQALILRAEGNRQAAILGAEGYALALEKIFGTAKGIDEKTMALQYLDALKIIGTGPSTKFLFPMEFTGLLKPFLNLGEKDSEKK